MTALVWMGALSVISWVLVTWLAPARVNPELAFAMGGTLASAMVSWIVTERTQRAAPERVTGVMVASLAAKMVFFGTYVVIVVRLVGVRPIPFVIGFTGYFIGLHVVEALFLKRLFGETARPVPGA
jgi:hypothetical protein